MSRLGVCCLLSIHWPRDFIFRLNPVVFIYKKIKIKGGGGGGSEGGCNCLNVCFMFLPSAVFMLLPVTVLFVYMFFPSAVLFVHIYIFVKRCIVCLNMFLPSAVPVNWWVTRLSFLFSLHLCWLFPPHLFPKECPWTLWPWQSRVRKCTLSRAWWFLWRVLHK